MPGRPPNVGSNPRAPRCEEQLKAASLARLKVGRGNPAWHLKPSCVDSATGAPFRCTWCNAVLFTHETTSWLIRNRRRALAATARRACSADDAAPSAAETAKRRRAALLDPCCVSVPGVFACLLPRFRFACTPPPIQSISDSAARSAAPTLVVLIPDWAARGAAPDTCLMPFRFVKRRLQVRITPSAACDGPLCSCHDVELVVSLPTSAAAINLLAALRPMYAHTPRKHGGNAAIDKWRFLESCRPGEVTSTVALCDAHDSAAGPAVVTKARGDALRPGARLGRAADVQREALVAPRRSLTGHSNPGMVESERAAGAPGHPVPRRERASSTGSSKCSWRHGAPC